MIKLELSVDQVNKVMDIYGKSYYSYRDMPEKKSLYAALKEKIESVINTTTEFSDRIVGKFLRNNFVDGSNNISENMIQEYLKKKEIGQVIVDFWCCVADVWIAELGNDGSVRDDFKDCMNGVTAVQIGEKLSKWDGVRKYVMNWRENGAEREECLDLVRAIITANTFPLFHIPNEGRFRFDMNSPEASLNDKFEKQMENQKPFDIMKFRYHIDVFGKREGNIRGALDKLGEIFDYDYLLLGIPRHEVLTTIFVPVCPYCNRQYITKYGQIGHEKTTADLDHFYHKSLYPFLALSVYNFVPSCSICNSIFKGTVDFYAMPHLYPYTQQSNSEMKFQLNDINLLWEIKRWKNDGVEEKLAVKINPGENVDGDRVKAVVNNKRVFHLEEIYQSHTAQVYELMCRALVYSNKRIRDLYKVFSVEGEENSSKLFFDEMEIYNMVFGQYLDEGEMHNRPLAKMTHDLLEDLWPEIERIKWKRGWQG